MLAKPAANATHDFDCQNKGTPYLVLIDKKKTTMASCSSFSDIDDDDDDSNLRISSPLFSRAISSWLKPAGRRVIKPSTLHGIRSSNFRDVDMLSVWLPIRIGHFQFFGLFL